MRKKEPKVKVIKVSPTERHIPLEEKICPQCGRRFAGMKRQKYCSKRCSNLSAYWRNPETYREARLKSYRKQKRVKKT
jgi:hypothetical protein